MQTFLIVLLMIASVSIIIATLLQEPKTEGMGTLTGSETNVFGKMAHKSKDAILSKIVVVAAVVFMLSAIILAAL